MFRSSPPIPSSGTTHIRSGSIQLPSLDGWGTQETGVACSQAPAWQDQPTGARGRLLSHSAPGALPGLDRQRGYREETSPPEPDYGRNGRSSRATHSVVCKSIFGICERKSRNGVARERCADHAPRRSASLGWCRHPACGLVWLAAAQRRRIQTAAPPATPAATSHAWSEPPWLPNAAAA